MTPLLDRARKLLAPALLLLSFTAAHAADPVTIGLAVDDAHGTPIEGLPQSAFNVTVDGKPIALTGFREINHTAAPNFQQIIFVIDGINLDIHGMSEARLQLADYLRAHPQLPMLSSVLLIGDEQEQFLGEPTQNGAQLASQLANSSSRLRAITRASGAEGAAERIGMSLQALGSLDRVLASQHGRKLVLWISGGWAFFPLYMPTAKEQRSQFAAAVEYTNALLDEGITLDGIDPAGAGASLGFQATIYRDYLKGVKRMQDMQPGNLALQVLAVHSGGTYQIGDNDMSKEVDRAVRERSAYYVLQFPREAGAETPTYHAIDVKVASPGATVHTTTGYYAVP